MSELPEWPTATIKPAGGEEYTPSPMEHADQLIAALRARLKACIEFIDDCHKFDWLERAEYDERAIALIAACREPK